MKKALVCGAGGFIGGHMVKRLLDEGYKVLGVDIKPQQDWYQVDPDNPNCEESSAYPAAPDSEYGWEKLFSERMWRSFARNYGIDVRIARFHNIFGPFGTWDGGKEKAPAAMCRKALQAVDTLEVWGPGNQTRSFLYIDECLEAVRRLMESEVTDVINIGNDFY